MALETDQIDQWIYETLTGSVALQALIGTRVYNFQIPQSQSPVVFPAVVFNDAGGRDILGVGGTRIMVSHSYQVRVIDKDQEGFGTTTTIFDLIDSLLHNKSHGSLGILSCVREQAFKRVYDEEGATFREVAAYFQIEAQHV